MKIDFFILEGSIRQRKRRKSLSLRVRNLNKKGGLENGKNHARQYVRVKDYYG